MSGIVPGNMLENVMQKTTVYPYSVLSSG